jgi:hypothetical protein
MLNGALITIPAPAVDADPNATQPPEDRVAVLPIASAASSVLWVGAVGGAPTVQVWVAPLGDTPRTWFLVTTAAPIAPASGAAVMLPPGVVPAGVPVFVRVTVVGGATKIAAGLTRG